MIRYDKSWWYRNRILRIFCLHSTTNCRVSFYGIPNCEHSYIRFRIWTQSTYSYTTFLRNIVEAGHSFLKLESFTQKKIILYTLRKLYPHFLSTRMGYDRGDKIWFKIERKTVTTIISHSIWKEMETLFSQCITFIRSSHAIFARAWADRRTYIIPWRIHCRACLSNYLRTLNRFLEAKFLLPILWS